MGGKHLASLILNVNAVLVDFGPRGETGLLAIVLHLVGARHDPRVRKDLVGGEVVHERADEIGGVVLLPLDDHG